MTNGNEKKMFPNVKWMAILIVILILLLGFLLGISWVFTESVDI